MLFFKHGHAIIKILLVEYMLYISTSHFQRFLCKKPKKARMLQQISAKNRFFAFHQNAGRNIQQMYASPSAWYGTEQLGGVPTTWNNA